MSDIPDPPLPSAAPADGQMEFGLYTVAQLRDMLLVLDAKSFPLNAARLKSELEGRATAAAQAGAGEQQVRYTPADGWLGWWQAKRRRTPFFGEGTAAVADGSLRLSGWRRTWLGSADRREQTIPLNRVRNVACDGALLTFDIRIWTGFWRRMAVVCKSAQAASSLLGQLPQRRSSGFEHRWEALRHYSRRVEQGGTRPRVTGALVLLNMLVFAAFVLVNRAWVGLTWADLLNWGANYGPLTTSTQWWRLLTALFLHGGLFHLIVNMWVLWNAGRLTERLFGSGRYALLYFGSGLVASIASIVWKPSVISIGASGPIFGVLGGFIAYALLPRTRLPLQVLRTHWLSTTVFALFSLVNGMFSQGIDNAAHVGGFLSGLLLGFVLARPLPDLKPVAAQPLTPGALQPQWLGPAVAVLCVTGLLGVGFWHVHGLRDRVTAPTAYLKSHEWLAAGEQKNLASWVYFGNQLDAGAISPAEFGRRLRSEVLPFWEDSKQRLEAELGKLPRAQFSYAADMQSYVEQRLSFVRDMIDTVDHSTITSELVQQHVVEIQQAQARLERRRLNADAELAPHALANASWVLRLRHMFGGSGACVDPPTWTGRVVKRQDQQSDGPAQRHAIQCTAQLAFRARDFTALESLLKIYPPADADPIEGVTRHGSMYSGLGDWFQYGNIDVNNTLAAIADWKHQYPESIAPALVESNMFISTAWAARGGGYAKEVSQRQWQVFGARLTMARAALDDVRQQAGEDPHWYVLRLIVGKGMSDSRSDMGRTYSTGVGHFPRYLPLASAWLNNLMPRWGGSFEEVDAVINMQARKSGPDADETYARLYSQYAGLEGDEEAFYKEGKMDWDRIQNGFAGLLRRYPYSDAVLNDYAYLACRAGKSTDFSELRPRLEGHVASTSWGIKHSLEWCVKNVH